MKFYQILYLKDAKITIRIIIWKISNGEPKNLIEFLDKTIEDIYRIYINEEKDKIPEFNLENDLTAIKEEKGENYKIKYKEYALDLISIINEPGEIK